MLDSITKRRIDTCRDMLVGKVPDPKSQVEQITIALIYKFMDDMDAEAEELGGSRSFFAGDYAKYGWANLMSPRHGGQEVLNLYSEALAKMPENPGIPPLFRDIFKNAYLPYRDPETLRSFLREINGFTYDHSERLGDAFEYLLQVLGSQGDAGQFRTPRHIIDFIVDVVDPQLTDTILDPACGTAGFLISAYKHIMAAHTEQPLTADQRNSLAQNLIGYDISPDMVRLSLVNLYLHGFRSPQIEEYDTLTSDDHWNVHADVILANPPFMSPKGGIKPHKRFSVQSNRSEVLFVDYIAEHLTPQGRAGVIVPEGIIFQSGGAYKELRKMLVTNYLVAVVSLPAGIFQPYSGVKTSILIMDRQLAKRSDSILFVKVASDGFGLGAQRRAIATNDLPVAATQLKSWFAHLRNGTEFDTSASSNATIVPKSKIAESGEYNLSGERYIAQGIHTSTFEVVTISDVCEINPKKSELAGLPLDTSVSFVPMQDVNENQIRFLAKETRNLEEVSEKGYTYFRNGDVLLAKVTPCFENGKAGVANGLLNGIGFGSSEYYVLRPSERILPELLYYFVASGRFKQTAVPKMTGTGGLQRVPRSVVADFQIPLPPLAVQQEIVAEIEGYQKIIDGSRQVVDNYKPRIDVRPEWPTVELGEVCDVNPKKSELSYLSEETVVSFVPMADLSDSDMLFGLKEARLLGEVNKQYTYFKDEDVLLAKVTPCFENGKSGIARCLKNGIGFGSTEFYVLRADSNKVIPEWLYVNVTNEVFINSGKLSMTGTGGLQRVPRDFLSSWQIPLPNLETQKAIVAQIEQEQRLVDANKELIGLFDAKIKATIGRVWGEPTP